MVLEWRPFAWLEEDQPVTGHPRDVFKRVDILPSSRRVRVSLDGQTLADTTHAMALHETLIHTRWYLPRNDVRMELLAPSESHTTCTYKGQASYFSLADGRPSGADIAWTYPDPLHEAAWVKDMLCFYSERTDLELDGAEVPRPVSPWSSPADQARIGSSPDRARAPEARNLLQLGGGLPRRRRATISCWICWVPSKMSRILESRAHFSSRSCSL